MVIVLGDYMYLEATGHKPCVDRTFLMSPRFPPNSFGDARCLKFDYNMYGRDIGSLTVRDEYGVALWRRSLPTEKDGENVWLTRTMTIPPSQRLFVFEFVRGGLTIHHDKGDIAIDNVLVTVGSCTGKETTIAAVYYV